MPTSYASSRIFEKIPVLLDRCGGGLMPEFPGHQYEFDRLGAPEPVEYGRVNLKFLPEKVALWIQLVNLIEVAGKSRYTGTTLTYSVTEISSTG